MGGRRGSAQATPSLTPRAPLSRRRRVGGGLGAEATAAVLKNVRQAADALSAAIGGFQAFGPAA